MTRFGKNSYRHTQEHYCWPPQKILLSFHRAPLASPRWLPSLLGAPVFPYNVPAIPLVATLNTIFPDRPRSGTFGWSRQQFSILLKYKDRLYSGSISWAFVGMTLQLWLWRNCHDAILTPRGPATRNKAPNYVYSLSAHTFNERCGLFFPHFFFNIWQQGLVTHYALTLVRNQSSRK